MENQERNVDGGHWITIRISFLDMAVYIGLSLAAMVLVVGYAGLRYHQVNGSWLSAALLMGMSSLLAFIGLILYKVASDLERLVEHVEDQTR